MEEEIRHLILYIIYQKEVLGAHKLLLAIYRLHTQGYLMNGDVSAHKRIVE